MTCHVSLGHRHSQSQSRTIRANPELEVDVAAVRRVALQAGHGGGEVEQPRGKAQPIG